MANALIARSVAVGAAYAPLAAAATVCSCRLRCPLTNAAAVNLRSDLGTDVPLEPGCQFDLTSVDLANLYVNGTAPDVVIIVGGTW